MFDLEVYYLTELVSLLGPVTRVVGNSKRYFYERTITSQPRYGEKIKVDIDTHITVVMEFANNLTTTVVMSFNLWDLTLYRTEIYGKEGTLYLTDDDTYGTRLWLEGLKTLTGPDFPPRFNERKKEVP